MKYEDEESLCAVEDRENIGKRNRRLVDIEKPKGPRYTQQNDQDQRSLHPRTVPMKTKKMTTLHIWSWKDKVSLY